MTRSLLAYGLVIVSASALLGQQAAPRIDTATLKGSVPIDIVFLRDHGPLLVRIHVMQKGEPIQMRWQQYIERWFNYLDRKSEGALDEAELGGAPNAVSMRNLAAQGAFFPNRGLTLSTRDFGKSSDQTVTKAEFVEYYRKNGIGAVQTSFAPPEPTGPANASLFKLLDRDGDGKLSRAEVEGGRDAVGKLDVDDDELIALRELAPAVVQTSMRGTVTIQQPQPAKAQSLQGTSFFHIASDSSRTGLATLMLARYDKNKRMTLTQKDIGLEDAGFNRLDENRNGTLDLIELSKLPLNSAAVELVINLGGNSTAPVAVAKYGTLPPDAFRTSMGTLNVALGDADIGVQNADVGQGRVAFNQFAFIIQQLKAADTKTRGYVELKDLEGPQQQFLRTLFPVLDRDEDGKLTEKETQAYLDLQGAGRDVTASFFVQEQGRNWFQLFDANRDGQLSPRELLTAWQRLEKSDKNGDGMIDTGELPMQFRVSFNPAGNQQFIVANAGGGMMRTGPGGGGNYPPQTPLWLRKMDRNGDGDVSRREFLGTREDFDRIDRNSDGLIDPAEAAAILQKK